jgi:hypothetical protein
VGYANWKEFTPSPSARLRQVQRWRRGDSGGAARPKAKLLFHYLWPLGEHQRQAVDPLFEARPTELHASHRIFLHNCSQETVREVRIRLAGAEVGYEPAITPGRFAEVSWVKHPPIRTGAIAAAAHTKLVYPVRVDFAVERGRKRASLEGEFTMDSSDGWVSFSSEDGQAKEIE